MKVRGSTATGETEREQRAGERATGAIDRWITIEVADKPERASVCIRGEREMRVAPEWGNNVSVDVYANRSSPPMPGCPSGPDKSTDRRSFSPSRNVVRKIANLRPKEIAAVSLFTYRLPRWLLPARIANGSPSLISGSNIDDYLMIEPEEFEWISVFTLPFFLATLW